MKKFYCRSLTFILILLSTLFLSGEDPAESALANQDNQEDVHLTWLSLLLGKKTVSDIIKNVDANDYATEAEVVTDEYGRQIALTKMMIAFKPNATPSQFEVLLDSLDATITSSVAGTRSAVVRIPQPTNLAAYYSLIEQIEAEPFVDFVWKGEIPRLNALPTNYQSDPPNPNELPHIDNHLAIRAHAAWNAVEAIDTYYNPRIVVADSFGEGHPINNTINSLLTESQFRDTGPEDGHGYAVLGIIAGTHGGVAGTQYYTTGIYPKTIKLEVIDHPNTGSSNWLIFGEIMNKLLTIITSTPGKIVVNTSIGYACDGTGGDCIDIAEARTIASLWVEYVRLFSLEDRVFHATSAGNIKPISGSPGLLVRDASTNSPFTGAARLSGLKDQWGQPMANLTNTAVIESAVNIPVGVPPDIQPIATKCLYKDSFIGGNISGIGTSVRSFIDSTSLEYDLWTGTSYATPQVSGLAAYLWSIEHALTSQQIKTLLTATSDAVPVISDPECSDWAAPAPIVDAYEALLALDAVDTPSVSNSPVRFSVLDVHDDGSFDEDDLQLLVDTYYDTSGADPVLIEPDVPDYGRYDLNGDGWTGGSSTIAFDLDRVGSIQYGMPNITNNVTQDIEGTAFSFNENTVRDSDILCYYAYSNLYSGAHMARQNLLEGVCHQGVDQVECTYNGGTNWWSKVCFDEDTGISTSYHHSQLGGDGKITAGTYNVNVPGSSIENMWALLYDLGPSDLCNIEKPNDWWLFSARNYGSGFWQFWDWNTALFPYHYKVRYQDGPLTEYMCWPNWPMSECNDGCVSMFSIYDITQFIGFPGTCSAWWDHTDEEGVFHTCGQ